MCGVCGCGEAETIVEGHHHHHDHSHHHHHVHNGDEHSEHGAATTLAVEQRILASNERYAAQNRDLFGQRGIRAVNLVSSPGSGKTTLLVATLQRLGADARAAVIEGDQQTSLDAQRIRDTGAPAVQVNTGKGCHLDAHMVGHAVQRLDPPRDSLLLIENVGNLVCPADFDLGEARRVLILSVTEGEDKPLKYSNIFRSADLMVLNKADLLPHLQFDVAACVEYARQVNPDLEILTLSAQTGEGMQAWLDWLLALSSSPS